MHVFLETERMLLRRFTEADLDNLFHLHNDPEVMRFINGGKPVSRVPVCDGEGGPDPVPDLSRSVA